MSTAYPSKVQIGHAMSNDICYKSKDLIGGTIIKTGSRIASYGGGYAIVYPFMKSGGKKIVVRCWWADIGNAEKRMMAISSYLNNLKSPYFIKLDYQDKALLVDGILRPIVIMDYVEALNLKDYVKENINNRATVLNIAKNFKIMVVFLHKNGIAHGDLSHGNIKVKADDNLVLIDYDSMFVKALKDMPDNIKGIPGYQHPARKNNAISNAKLDYFSELVIYLSLLVFADYPECYDQYHDTEDLLFSIEDYENPHSSPLIKKLRTSLNSQIVNLTNTLIEYLAHDDITSLRPLEEILRGSNKYNDDMINEIIDKF